MPSLVQALHQVVAVDSNKEAFNRLHPDFRGRTLEGERLAESVLECAGIRPPFFARAAPL